jgi:hypothetical protein
MLLTSVQHRDIARRACWYFDCYFGPPSDSVVFTGDGLEDLNSLIERLNNNAAHNRSLHQRFQCDVGTQYSDWRPFDIEDVTAIRTQFIAFYGSVDRPDEYAPGASSAFSTRIVNEAGGSSPQEAE